MKTEILKIEVPVIPRIYSAKPTAEIMFFDGYLWRRRIARYNSTPHAWEKCDEQTEDAVIDKIATETTPSQLRLFQAMLHAMRQTNDSPYLSKTGLVRNRQQIDDCIEYIKNRLEREIDLLPQSEEPAE